ncbi:biotin-dependent carboxyltransferase family protein [Paraglaciecola aquimarina]|uniref:Biotin-dependent carboxyltransferase family protein n=1 Tax=Paraglaciecola aquimarina TaxID=1235557 RepID=A0ABU3T175_9ALTE|nr:biotin-dependent carboxyltransferase family protein [Paraglaciecola aquimarina]MDU0356035.1 biotin-dependent carboxyltransferase family protein [Paraglaciecola aquimarina]
MSIEVIKGGMQTSIQDQGRHLCMQWGIAQGGAMDTLSMSIANLLLGNCQHHPVLEICLMGPSLHFTTAISIAICGAKFQLTVENKSGQRPVFNDQTINLSPGDTLHFGKRIEGARAYLAFAGQLTVSKIQQSYATHFLAKFGGTHGRALVADDRIELTNCELRAAKQLQTKHQQHYSGKYLLRCIDGPEKALFNKRQATAFYQTDYKVSNASNRMGLRLDGLALEDMNFADMTSSGLLPGSIQIPANGLPIISSVDGQTIGGYPRIANVIRADLFALGQLLAGDSIRFVQVDLEQASTLYIDQQDWLATICS